MASKEQYAQWIVANQDKKGTPEFETVAAAYKAAGAQTPESDQLRSTILPDDGKTYFERMKEGFTPQRLAGSQPARALAGAVSPLVAAAQVGAMIGDVAAQAMGYEGDTAEKIGSAWQSLRDYQEGGRTDSGMDLEYMAGNIGTGLGLTSRVAPALTPFGRIAQGGATGAGLAMTNPAVTEYPGAEKLTQALLGAAAGAAVPAVGEAWRFGANRLTDAGIEKQVGVLLNDAAGPRRDAVIEALKTRSGAPPVGPRPLSAPTAGQAAAPAGSAEFSALQRVAANRADPSTYGEIGAAQSRAQIDALRRVGGTEDDLARAVTARASASNPLYRAAEQSDAVIDPRRTISLIDRIIQARPKEKAFSALQGIRDSLYNAYPAIERAKDSWNSVRGQISSYKGAVPPELISARQILNNVKNFDLDEYQAIAKLQALKPKDATAATAIKDAIKNLEIPDRVVAQDVTSLASASRNIQNMIDDMSPDGRRVNAAIVRELTTIKKSLDAKIGQSVPEYAAARSTYRDMSRPVNQMEIGQLLEQRLAPALSDQGATAVANRPAALAQALRDSEGTIRSATGFKRGTSLESIMEPAQMDIINKVGKDLANNADFERLAQQGTSRVNDMLNNMYTEKAGSMLSRVMMIFNTILSKTGRAATEKGMKVVAEVMQDPIATAKLMESASAAEKAEIQTLLSNIFASQSGAAASSAASSAEDYLRN